MFNNTIMANSKAKMRKHINMWRNRTKVNRNGKDPVIVTVHVRRDDYIEYMRTKGGHVMEKPYFSAAFAYFTKK